MKRNKLLWISLICLTLGVTLAIAYLNTNNTLTKLDGIQYKKGELFRYDAQRKKLNRREFKKQLDIYLIADENCYKGSSYFISSINEQKFFQFSYTGAPIEIGYIETSYPLVKEMYDLKIEILPSYNYYPYRYYYGYYHYYDFYDYKKWQNDSIQYTASYQSIVNLNGIKNKLKNESLVFVLLSCFLILLSLFFGIRHIRSTRKTTQTNS